MQGVVLTIVVVCVRCAQITIMPVPIILRLVEHPPLSDDGSHCDGGTRPSREKSATEDDADVDLGTIGELLVY